MERKILEKINNANKILLISHVNPDGDTLASCLCMQEFLNNRPDILIQAEKIPSTYEFLPLKNVKFQNTLKDEYDLIIALDVASIDRITGFGRELFEKGDTINIDHHKTNKGYGKLNLVRGGYSSTGEVLFDFFNTIGAKITKEMAEALYVSVLTDTGCFKYETVTEKTFLMASKLMETGIDISEIAKKCYDNKPKSMVTFQANVVSNAVFTMDDRVCYTILTQNLMKKYKVSNEHTEGIAETLRSIASVDISIVLKENPNNTTKISLRSKSVDLEPVVKKFNGGGHKRAAGCTIKKPAKEAIELVLDEIAKCLK